jgi:hypothetical protein
MLSFLLVELYYGARDHLAGPCSTLSPRSFDLQRFCQLVKFTSTLPPPLTSPATSSILREIQQDPSYKAFQRPQTTLCTTPKPVPTIESIPSELQLAIMSQLPDIKSLRRLSLASPELNRLRIEHQATVLAAILNREIDACVLEQAYWAVRAAQQSFDSSNHGSKLRDFMAEFSDDESGPPETKNLPLADLIKISDLHVPVTTLVEDFCAYAFAGPLAPSPGDSKPTKISSMEFNRIGRAFYRFELYCNLYKDHPVIEDETLQDTNRLHFNNRLQIKMDSFKLFDSWNAWEVEGVACIRDYFCARLTEAFASIQEADHSAPSGPSFLHQDRDTDHLKEMFMNRGLTFLCKLLMASSGCERYQMFQSIMHDLSCSETRDIFITYALRAVPLGMRPGRDMVEAFCHADELLFEGDINAAAPPLAWIWVNDRTCQPFYAQKHMEYLRSLGYVMWNKDRLSPTSFFNRRHSRRRQPYDPAPYRLQAMDEHQLQCSRPSMVLDPSELCTLVRHVPRAVSASGSSKTVRLDESSGADAAKSDCTPQIQPVESSTHSTLESTLDATVIGESMANPISAKPASSEKIDLDCETTHNNPQPPIVEGDDGSGRSMNDEIVDKAQADETEVSLVAVEGPVAATKTARSDSGYASIIPPPLHPQAIQETEIAQDDLAKHGDGPDHAPVAESIPVAEMTPEVLRIEHSFDPVMPVEVNSYAKSFSNVDHFIDSSSQEDHSPNEVDPTIEAAVAELEGCTGPPRARKMARAISPKAKMMKSQEKLEQQQIEHQADPTIDAAAVELEGCAGPPRARRMARAISPKAKMIKSQQKLEQQQTEHKAETPIPNLTGLEGPIPIRCTTPESTLIPVRAASPSLSGCSSTSSDSINWITSPPSSVKAKEQGPPADTMATKRTSPRPRQSAPSTDADGETEHEAKPAATISSTDLTPYTMGPSEIAAWIESQERRLSSSSSSANASNPTPSKQQRKKANRKARNAMMELGPSKHRRRRQSG